MIIPDASFWVSSLVVRDAFHDSSRRFAGSWSENGELFAIPTLFLVEVSGVLTRNGTLENKPSRDVYRDLDSRLFIHFAIDEELERRSVEIAHSAHLRSADAVYVALAEQLSVPLVTWDDEQLERGGQVVHALTPEQALKELL